VYLNQHHWSRHDPPELKGAHHQSGAQLPEAASDSVAKSYHEKLRGDLLQ